MAEESEVRVLDKGFVRLVEQMGGDSGVVLAARVSYRGGLKGEEKDRKLVHYLLKHMHLTPFEHAVFKFHVSCPIFIARQWFRHRFACVTDDTILYFDLPKGQGIGSRRGYRMRVDEFNRKWHFGAKPIPHWKKPTSQVVVPQRDRLRKMRLRSLDETAWQIGHTCVTDIIATGERPVFEVQLEDGKTIFCTEDHRFRFEDGWKTLKEGAGLGVEGRRAVYNSELPRLAVNGRCVAEPLYRDRPWLAEQYARPGASDESIANILHVSSHVVRKWRRIHGLVGLKPRAFFKGHSPWNKGKSYKLEGQRQLTPEHLASIRAARSGAASNFWKGGVSSLRARIARWTTDVGPTVFRRDAYQCRSCGVKGGRLHAHHVIPVWADKARAFDVANLAAVCESCHRRIHRTNSELDFADSLLGSEPVKPYECVTKRRSEPTRLVPKWVRIRSIRYAGVRPTFDLSVEGPFHNYVANGIVTHNSYNEISYRYTEVGDEFYVPQEFRAQDAKNKQASTTEVCLDQGRCREVFERTQKACREAYQNLLEKGVAREMARMILPVNLYTQFYWTVNARSLMNFISLRADSSAQWEIQKYAEALNGIFRAQMPWTHEAFLQHVWKGENEKVAPRRTLVS